MGPSLSDEQRLDWLQLIRTPRIGPALFQDLVNHFGSASAALEALPDMAARRGAPIRPSSRDDAAREIAHAKKLGAQFLARGEDGYPALLAKTERPPPLLCASIKHVEISAKPGIALVGARNASAGGISVARAMAQALGEAGYGVISGLARGIDAAAHMGALDCGTLAFVAGGLAKPYPPEHSDLMRQIVDRGGAVYSEMPLSWTARAQDFPRRNRLVAGACQALVVIEAARRSGSLITARQALELGRDVMAVPGFPLDPRGDGPNSLIRDGAKLVRDARDVLEEIELPGGTYNQGTTQPDLLREPVDTFSSTATAPVRDEPHSTDEVEQLLGHTLSYSPTPTDMLVANSGLPASSVRVWLLENELAGRIVRSAGDRFAWNPDNATRAVD